MNESGSKPLVNYSPILATLGTIFLYFAAQIVAVVLVFIVARLILGVDLEGVNQWLKTPLAQMLLTLIIGACILAGVFLLLRVFGAPLKEIGWVKPRRVDVKFTLAGFFIYIPVVILLLSIVIFLIPGIDPTQQQQLGFDRDIQGRTIIFAFVSLVLLPPLIEEVLVRGFLFTGLRKKMNFLWAALVSSLLFGLAHLQLASGEPPLWLVAGDTFVLGMVAAALREKTGRLWASIGLHALKNLLAFTIVFTSIDV